MEVISARRQREAASDLRRPDSVKLTLRPIEGRSNTVLQIVEQFKENLINGQLKPGDQIPPEPVLCEQLGVSRTPVREAIRMLAAVGHVEVRRGSGTFIASPSLDAPMELLGLTFILAPKTKAHMLELRRVFECMCGELAIEHATEEDLQRLSETIREFDKAVGSKQGPKRLRVLDVRFHELLFEATHNPIFSQLGKAVMTAAASTMQRALHNREGYAAALEDHMAMLKAIQKRSLTDYLAVVRRSMNTWQKLGTGNP